MTMSKLDRLTSAGVAASAQGDLAVRLLHAATPAEVAEVLLADPRARGASVLWSTHWPRDIVCHPPQPRDSAVVTATIDAVVEARNGGDVPAHLRILQDDGYHMAAVLHCPDGCPDLLEPAAHRLGEVLAIQRMQESVARLEQAEMLQRSLYAIADMAGSDLDMPDMLRGLHRIVSDLMYAENFYIALYDSERDSLRFLYFADVVDTQNLDPDEEIRLAQIERGLTWYLVRDRKPLMGSTEQLREQVSGPLRVHGPDSSDWLGVPMMREGGVLGALVVQSYLEGMQYTTAEMSLLAFVAEHVLTALERKTSQSELERRVTERTLQLAETNVELRREVAERERGRAPAGSAVPDRRADQQRRHERALLSSRARHRRRTHQRGQFLHRIGLRGRHYRVVPVRRGPARARLEYAIFPARPDRICIAHRQAAAGRRRRRAGAARSRGNRAPR